MLYYQNKFNSTAVIISLKIAFLIKLTQICTTDWINTQTHDQCAGVSILLCIERIWNSFIICQHGTRRASKYRQHEKHKVKWLATDISSIIS